MDKNFVISSLGFDPYYNLSLEEYLLEQTPDQGCILYLWQNQHTVVIGKNQNPWAECRLSLLQEEGGHLARRLSGGGAVYHDLGNLNFTFLCKEKNYDLDKQLSVIKRAAELAGVPAEFSGRNDLLAYGRKFSGNAFYRGKVNSYHHGTLLVDADMEKLQRYLSPPKAKLESKGIASVRSRVVNLKELSPALTCDKMKEFMEIAFTEIYGNAAELTLSESEQQAVLQLRTRYASEQWLLGRALPFTCRMEGRLPFGHLELQLQVTGGVIEDLQVYTDAMDADLPQAITRALKNCPFGSESMCQALAKLDNADTLCDFIRQQNI